MKRREFTEEFKRESVRLLETSGLMTTVKTFDKNVYF